MKKIVSLVLAVLLCLTMFSAIAEELKPKNGDKFVVAYLNRRNDNEFLVWMMDETVKRLEEDGRFEVRTYDGMNDNQKQIQQIEDCITMDVDFVFLSVNDMNAQTDAMYLLNDAGIPIIEMSTEAAEGPDFYMVGIANTETGYMQGQYLMEHLPENGKILYAAGRSGTSISSDRKEGFYKALEDSGRTDYEVLAELEYDYTSAACQKLVEDWTIAYEDFDAIVCVNDQGAYGAVEALKAANRLDGVMVLGIDAETVMLEAIAAGEATMTVKQDVPAHADQAYEIVCKLIEGKQDELQKRYDIPLVQVTADNVNDYL